MPLHKLLKSYEYSLPAELIAQSPASPRDSARVLVFNKKNKSTKFDTFANLDKYLPKNAVLVFNQTKVVPARIPILKDTGGKAELLYLGIQGSNISALCNKKLAIDSFIKIPGSKYKLKVLNKKNGEYLLLPEFNLKSIPKILNAFGKTPLPPYIKNSPLSEKQKRKEYQSVFAKTGESVAAPTASLHFTKALNAKLKKQGIQIEYVNLNVGLGTFAPLTEEKIKNKKLHKETYEISKNTANILNLAKQQGRPIIAVGTTVIRTLESAAVKHKLQKLSGSTEIFIQPGYKFQFIDGVITNFHVPKSSLMMLIASIVGGKALKNLYTKAIKLKFRFFSFGDGMLILPK